jgi:hypothetical protein
MSDKPGLDTLPDDDIWLRYNILLQAVDELHRDYGHAGDASRQLRIVSQEMSSRGLFLYMIDDLNDDQIMQRYLILDQLFAKWPETPRVEEQWREVIEQMKTRDIAIPPRVVTVDPLLVAGRAIKGKGA